MTEYQNENNHTPGILSRAVDLYVDGFRNMTVGRSLWVIIIIKVFILFAILKLFFFPDFLGSNFDNDQDRAQHVRNQLIHDNN